MHTRFTTLVWALAVVFAACGRIDYGVLDAGASEVDTGARDAGLDATRANDAGPARDGQSTRDAGLVAPLYGEPSPIGELGSASAELDPTLTEDELEIYFISDRTGNPEIWSSTRMSVDAPWAAPMARTELLDPLAETDPEISPDGLHLFFSSQRGARDDVDIWETTRRTRSDRWEIPVRIDSLASDADECCAQTDPLSLHLVFARVTMAGGPDLHVAEWNDAAGWIDIARIVELSSPAADSNPFLSGGWVFFDSDRPGVGARDVYLSRRASATDPFEPPVLVESLSTAADERDVWATPDLRRVYFSRDVGGDDQELFVVERLGQ